MTIKAAAGLLEKIIVAGSEMDGELAGQVLTELRGDYPEWPNTRYGDGECKIEDSFYQIPEQHSLIKEVNERLQRWGVRNRNAYDACTEMFGILSSQCNTYRLETVAVTEIPQTDEKLASGPKVQDNADVILTVKYFKGEPNDLCPEIHQVDIYLTSAGEYLGRDWNTTLHPRRPERNDCWF